MQNINRLGGGMQDGIVLNIYIYIHQTSIYYGIRDWLVNLYLRLTDKIWLNAVNKGGNYLKACG